MDENGDRLPGIDDMELDLESAFEPNMEDPHITADNAGGSGGSEVSENDDDEDSAGDDGEQSDSDGGGSGGGGVKEK